MNREELLYSMAIVIAAGVVTILLRALPFIAFGRKKETPGTIRYLGNVISPAAIAMLTVYCLFCHWQQCEKDFYAIPELIAAAAVVLLQYYKRNPLISILAGTVLYMVMVQNI